MVLSGFSGKVVDVNYGAGEALRSARVSRAVQCRAALRRLLPTAMVCTQYGASLRKQMKKMEVIQHSKYFCELCGKFAVKREAVGICICKDCGKVKAGGAYTLKLRKEITELGHQCFLEVKEISGDCECHVQGRQRKDLNTIQPYLNEDGAPQEVDCPQAWKDELEKLVAEFASSNGKLLDANGEAAKSALITYLKVQLQKLEPVQN